MRGGRSRRACCRCDEGIMSTEQALLAAIWAEPQDDTPRPMSEISARLREEARKRREKEQQTPPPSPPGTVVRISASLLQRPPLRQHLGEDAQHRLHLGGADAQRRTEANRTLAAAEQEQALVECELHHLLAQYRIEDLRLAILDDIHRHHQPQAAHLAHLRKLRLHLQQSLPQLLPALSRIGYILPLQ